MEGAARGAKAAGGTTIGILPQANQKKWQISTLMCLSQLIGEVGMSNHRTSDA